MLQMTSRRKQIKPIKAQSSQLSVSGTFTVSDSGDSNYCREPLLTITTTKENQDETVTVKLEKEPNHEEPCALANNHPTDCAPGDISKKIHKDDAKILPFETSGGIDYFRCPICQEVSISGRENLTSHLQEHQNKTKRDDGKHLCCLCTKELSSNSSLERHLLTHSNHRPFSCILCDKKFTTNGNLSRHIKTSHNNNGTIDSSIDEVLKKHHLQSSVPSTLDNIAIKGKKSHRPTKKEPTNVESMGTKGCTMNFMTSPLSFMDQSKSDCTAYQPILASQTSNVNLLSPFYSFNVNELGYISTNFASNYNILNSTNLSILRNTANNSIVECQDHSKSLWKKHLDSLLPNRLLATRRYSRKITCHVRSFSQIKPTAFSTNSIECTKCLKKILLSTNILSHIRFCYRSYKKSNLFCPFKLCAKRYSTLNKLVKHIKSIHLETYYHSIEPVSPPLEPLNLSLKDSLSTQSCYINEHRSAPFTGYLHNTKSSESVLDLSGSNSGVMIKNSCDISHQYNAFQTINQFISTPTIVTLSPFQFSTPLTFSTPSPLGKPASVPVIVNNNTLPGNIKTSWYPKLSQFGEISNLAKMVNNNEGETIESSCTMVNSLSTKFLPGIKKKNSYKDAPKLITCPMNGCVQKFPWNSSLMRHILTHTAHKPFKCTRCVKSFSTKSNRERHMTRVHRVRINRLKFKSLQASRSALEDLSKPLEDGIDSENGADGISTQDNDMRIMELSEEEWIIMDDNDRRAEDISSNLLKLAGQPIVEPNPVRLHNVERKIDFVKCDSSVKNLSSLSNESHPYLDNNCI